MTWSMLNEAEVAVYEKFEKGPCLMFSSPGPEGELWFRSPCGLPVATQGHCIEHALGILHVNNLKAAVLEILSSVDLDLVHDYCLADYYAGYGIMSGVAVMTERCRASCHYLLALKDVSDELRNGYIQQARNMARSALAKHYANDAIGETRFQLDVETIFTC